MTVGSLFAGIGGFDLGFERAGFTVRWQVEREPFCQRVLTARFGAAQIHDDVTTVGADLEPVDVLVGGFPCQDVSVAGKRAGLAGSRSNLFYEFARIAAELQAEWVVIENVPGLFSSRNGRDVSAILETLWECGYLDGAYRVLDSRYFGVAQRRRRCFFVGHRGSGQRARAVLFESESGARDSQTSREARPRLAEELAASLRFGGEGARGFNLDAECGLVCFDWQSGGDVRHNLSSSSSLQACQTPAIFQCHGSNVGPLGTLRSGNGNAGGGVPFLAHALTGTMHKRHDEDTDTLIASALTASTGHHGHSSPRGDGRDNLIAATLNSGGNDGGFRTEPGEHLLATFDERNVTSPDNRSRVEPGAPCHSLHASPPSLIGQGVRRLTPLECERLQGFPDGWTCLCGVRPYATQGCTCSDSPRYRALGNAVTVNVAEWIARRLEAVA